MARARRVLLLALLTVAVAGGSAGGATRTYSTGPLDYPIPDVGTLDVPLRVLQKGPVSYVEVSLHVDHPRDSDLTLRLVAPTGATVVLSAKRGGNGRNYGAGEPCDPFASTTFADAAERPIGRGKPPFANEWFKPEEPLEKLDGSEAAGVWKLRIADDRSGAQGTLRCFQLVVSRRIVETRTARGRGLQAQLSWIERAGAYTELRLRIVRRGRPAFDGPVRRRAPLAGVPDLSKPTGMHVRDLDGDGEPELLVDFFWGGIHCCWYTSVYRYVRRLDTYRPTIGFWGNLDPTIVDLDRDGRPEFKTGDDRFAYAFTSYAGSAFPIRILRFDHGRFVDVTRRFPRLVARDAATLYGFYRKERRRPDGDIGGILPAWLADQYLLGRGPTGWPVLREAVRRGEIQAWERPRTYLRKVRFFLRRTGYIRSARRPRGAPVRARPRA
jgi:subtilisin-like proprotein convertase family protein